MVCGGAGNGDQNWRMSTFWQMLIKYTYLHLQRKQINVIMSVPRPSAVQKHLHFLNFTQTNSSAESEGRPIYINFLRDPVCKSDQQINLRYKNDLNEKIIFTLFSLVINVWENTLFLARFHSRFTYARQQNKKKFYYKVLYKKVEPGAIDKWDMDTWLKKDINTLVTYDLSQ